MKPYLLHFDRQEAFFFFFFTFGKTFNAFNLFIYCINVCIVEQCLWYFYTFKTMSMKCREIVFLWFVLFFALLEIYNLLLKSTYSVWCLFIKCILYTYSAFSSLPKRLRNHNSQPYYFCSTNAVALAHLKSTVTLTSAPDSTNTYGPISQTVILN